MTEPRFYQIPSNTELPREWIESRGYLGEEYERTEITRDLRDRAMEIAPGIFVVLMGTGGSILPDGQAARGATIAVWTEKEEEG